ncbi:hypothetical protein K505DRAFT_244028 [Melanomma pulvis-pyrius CBS 109.77]|uniref:C3H1-type domain-containing protein n=1 Tax=Melanomma pulvis-pyrius CBS 109.77 TaxID=1314802 RepID=A0A6A6XB07_9PLEO|nr:hypothetical protein K505DRAFT_244028 [Melanomma pulvis-pyrius CBS 109.77]
MESFQRSDDARQQLLADILSKYANLVEEHTNLKHDFESEKEVRRKYQSEKMQIQRQLNDTQRELDGNSFVLALIDGDGVIFDDMFLQIAANGGSEAASKLQYAIREHIASIYNNSGNWSIMVQIYVSLDKLAVKLFQVGLLRNQFELRTFAQNFSVNQPLFSIIDVGQGKERADYKIKEMLRTFSDNPTCKHIIFGGCHDNGYLLDLDQYKHNQAKAARITLLESTPAQPGFAEMPNFKRARFDQVFRSEALPASQYQQHPMSSYTQAPMQPSFPAPGQPPFRTMSNKMPSPVASPIPAERPTPVPTPLASSPSTTASSLAGQNGQNGDSSWATVGKAGTVNGSISIAGNKAAAKNKKYVYYNKEGYRLDEPLPPRDRLAAEAIEMRMNKAGRNLCNHWHLNKGKCTNGEFCKFQHEPKLSLAELNALRYKTRSLACKSRVCENFDCYLGHQCSFERDMGYCPYPDTCHLKASHGMDSIKHVRYDEKGNEEYTK